MKRILRDPLQWMLRLALILAVGCGARAATIEGALEFFGDGDFDGDGRSDLVIVDRATGDYRLAYQLSAATYTWVKARAGGVDNVSSMSVGKLLTTTRDALVLTAPEANRLNVFDLSIPGSAGLPMTFFPSVIGPNLVIALDIGGGTPHDDLFLGSRLNNGTLNQITLLRNNAGAVSELSTAGSSGLLERGDRVLFKTGVPPLAGVVRRDALNTFIAFRLTLGTLVTEATLTGLPANVAYASGQFNVSVLSQFLFYAPGQSNLLLRPVQEIAGVFSFASGADFAMGDAIAQVITVSGTTPRLLVLFGGGTRAAVYDFNGTTAPALRQQFVAGAGETFTGAGVLGGGNFMMYSSKDGSGRSTFFQAYNFNGSSFVTGAGGSLPSVNALTARGNVMLFQSEPFVVPNVNLLASLNASDWSSQLGALPGPVSVQAESFRGTTLGVGSPVATSLGASPPAAMYGLVNQYSNFFSLFSLNAAQGDEVSDVRISPAPGLYKKGIVLAFTAADPSHQIFYRLDPADPWSSYSGAPVLRLFKNSTVQFYGKPAIGNAKSRVKSAVYSFTEAPGVLDSDGDGIPDYVEIAKGLDPLGGNDADGDGYPDLDELLAGSNPNNASDPATPITAIERQAVFDLAATPRPWDGTLSNATLSATGTAIRAYTLTGSLLAYGKTTNAGLSGVTDPVARLNAISLEPTERLLTVASEENFAIATSGTNKLLGREMLGLLPVPGLRPPFQVNYAYGGGALLTEASNWLAAAAASNALVHRALVVTDLTIYDTLSALLAERKISDLLLSRGVAEASNLTLFVFRPTEVSRYNPDLSTLLSLESLGASNQPAYWLQTLHASLMGLAKTSAAPAVVDLRRLTADIYRLSSASNNAAPGVYPSPVDTLRNFITTGVLHSNYLARTSLTGGQLASASTGMGALLASVPIRPTTNIELRVRPDSFTGPCTVLETTTLVPTPISLFHPGGQPYRLLEAFSLVPGARAQVFGFTDMTGPSCSGPGIEVISLQLSFIPEPAPTDLNGNLLADEWESLFGVSNPFGDDDGDGYSNLQEMFEGTDPKDGLSKPAGPIVVLSPPEIDAELMGGGTLKLSWDWPEPYASKVHFKVLSSPALGALFTDLGLMPTKVGGHFELTLPSSSVGAKFFTVLLTL